MKLVRPLDDRIIAGVASALARRFGVSVLLVRIIFVLLIPLPPSALLIYIILWILIPSEEKLNTIEF